MTYAFFIYSRRCVPTKYQNSDHSITFWLRSLIYSQLQETLNLSTYLLYIPPLYLYTSLIKRVLTDIGTTGLLVSVLRSYKGSVLTYWGTEPIKNNKPRSSDPLTNFLIYNIGAITFCYSMFAFLLCICPCHGEVYVNI